MTAPVVFLSGKKESAQALYFGHCHHGAHTAAHGHGAYGQYGCRQYFVLTCSQHCQCAERRRRVQRCGRVVDDDVHIAAERNANAHRLGAPPLEWQENLPSLVAPAAAAARYDEVVTLK